MSEHLIGTTTTASLDDLLVAAGRGDRSGFAELYDALAPAVYGLTSRLVFEADQAKDLARDVFVEVWRTSAGFDPTHGSARAWVIALAHRRAVDRARATGVGSAGAPRGGAGASVLGTRRDLLATLPSAERDTVELAYFGARTQQDIATSMQTSLEACQARMTTALGRLREAVVLPVAEPA